MNADMSLLVSIFYTTLVKKSQEGNGAFELRRTPPRTRVNRLWQRRLGSSHGIMPVRGDRPV
jgi:hypothetical protein